MCWITGQNEDTVVGGGFTFFHAEELRATGQSLASYQNLISAEQARRRYQAPTQPRLLGQSHFTRLA